MKETRDRKPGELLTPLKAVRAHCRGCCNELATEVALCTVTSCFLWPYRFGKRNRAWAIVAEEREVAPRGRHWAEELTDYTGQTYYRRQKGTKSPERADTAPSGGLSRATRI